MEVENITDPVSAGLADEARRWRQVKPGMSIGIMDVQLEAPVRYESRTFPAICLSVVLEGYATNNMEALEGGFCPDEVWVTSTGESVPTSMTIHAEWPVRVVELLLTPHWVADNRQRMSGDASFQSMAQSMSQPMMVRRCCFSPLASCFCGWSRNGWSAASVGVRADWSRRRFP